MPRESILIELDGEEDTDVYNDLLVLEVEVSEDLPATFRLQLAMPLETDGTWRRLDDERLRIWHELRIGVGYEESGHDEVFTGYITHVQPQFTPDPSQCVLDITGIDASVLMDRDEKLKAWPNKKDSDIAAEILSEYGFSPTVEDTTIVHDEVLSTVIQRESDLQFIRRLALRNGYAFYVQSSNAFFRPEPDDLTPQPLLAAHFGSETTLVSFSATVDALRPANVAMSQLDRMEKEVLTVETEESTLESLGELNAADLLEGSVSPGKVFVGNNAATGSPEMEALCQGLFHEGAWFVSVAGEVDSAAYGHVLRPRGLVTVKGVGGTYSGVYYVSYVRHTFTLDGYSQSFRARRDALLPTGAEDFEGGDGLFGL